MPSELSFRPITDGDVEFLARLYASTREMEMALTPWTPEQKNQFLRQQFEAQHQFYHQQFPGAKFDLVLRNQSPIGRLYVSRAPQEIRVIDIALLPEHRGRGLGSALMRPLLEEAKNSHRPVRLHVESSNPALSFYERLGFRIVEDKGVYQLMEWTF